MKDRDRPYYQIVDGFRLPGAYSEDNYRSCLRYVPDDDDIIIAEFPKCGSHWVTELLTASFQVGKGLEPGVTFLERFGLDGILKVKKPRIVQTHLPSNLLPLSLHSKHIVLLRNPKDCCVSFYHHSRNIPIYSFADGTFDEFFEIFLEGLTDFGSYYDFVRSWYEGRRNRKALFVTYESMHADIQGAVLKITDFVDHAMSEELRKNESKMKFVLEKINLVTMKTKYPVQYVRKGVVGDWKNYFSQDQARRMEERFFREMNGTSVSHLWKDVDWLL